MTVDEILATGVDCKGCRLASSSCKPYNYALGQGSEDAEIAFIGDVPSQADLSARYVFQGLGGQLFQMMLTKANIDPENIWLTNSVLCGIPKKAKLDTPWANEIQKCQPRIAKELRDLKNLKVIVAMGNWALRALGYDDNRKIGSSVGWVDWNVRLNCFVVATYGLPSVLRNNELYLDVQWTMGKAQELSTREPGVFLNRPELDLIVAETPEHACRMLDTVTTYALKQGDKRVSSDIETSGFEWYDRENHSILCVGFYSGERHPDDGRPRVYIIPETILYTAQVINAFRGYLADKGVIWEWHNGKFDIKWLRHHLKIKARVDADTLNIHYVLDERTGTHGLDDVAMKYCEAPEYHLVLKKYLPNKKTSFRAIPKDVLHLYAGYDCYYTYEAGTVLRKELAEQVVHTEGYPTFQDLLDTLLTPSLNIWSEIEMDGIDICEDTLDQMDKDVGKQLDDLINECRHIASVQSGGKDYTGLNLNSSTQLKKILYEDLKFPLDKRLGKQTTNRKYLETHAKHPFCAALLKFRNLAKLHSTYIRGFKKRLYNGKIYADFLFHGTVTGRLASRNPNMQNIPRSSFFKAVFVAPPGYVLCQADYSNLEVRTAAWYSEDPELLKALEGDIHWNVAEGVFGYEITYAKNAETIRELDDLLKATAVLSEMRLKHEITPFTDVDEMRTSIMKQLRHMTKYITFGILYGRGAKSLAENELNCSQKDAQKYIDNFHKKFHVLRKWMLETHETVINFGIVEIPTGRLRRFPCLTSQWDAQDAKNKSVNAKCQAMASDMNLLAALEIHPQFKKDGSGRLKFAVHDSLVSILREDMLIKALNTIKDKMENVLPEGSTPVKFPVDIQLGLNWKDLTDVKLIDGTWYYTKENKKTGKDDILGPVVDKVAA